MKHEELKALLLRDEALSRLDVPRGRMEAYADEAARTITQALVGEQDERDAAVRALLIITEQIASCRADLSVPRFRATMRERLAPVIAAVRKHFPEAT